MVQVPYLPKKLSVSNEIIYFGRKKGLTLYILLWIKTVGIFCR
jgi:hypothetical protein